MLAQLIAQGRTAEIFDWQDGQILKLYRDRCRPEWVEQEAQLTRAEIESWLLPVAVARSLEDIPNERQPLVRLIDSSMTRVQPN